MSVVLRQHYSHGHYSRIVGDFGWRIAALEMLGANVLKQFLGECKF